MRGVCGAVTVRADKSETDSKTRCNARVVRSYYARTYYTRFISSVSFRRGRVRESGPTIGRRRSKCPPRGPFAERKPVLCSSGAAVAVVVIVFTPSLAHGRSGPWRCHRDERRFWASLQDEFSRPNRVSAHAQTDTLIRSVFVVHAPKRTLGEHILTSAHCRSFHVRTVRARWCVARRLWRVRLVVDINRFYEPIDFILNVTDELTRVRDLRFVLVVPFGFRSNELVLCVFRKKFRRPDGDTTETISISFGKVADWKVILGDVFSMCRAVFCIFRWKPLVASSSCSINNSV